MRFSHLFQLFNFKERLKCFEFFEWKNKKINDAELFSQSPFLIFTKDAKVNVKYKLIK